MTAKHTYSPSMRTFGLWIVLLISATSLLAQVENPQNPIDLPFVDGVRESSRDQVFTVTQPPIPPTGISDPLGEISIPIDTQILSSGPMPVPEPSTFALGCLAFGALATTRLRSKRR